MKKILLCFFFLVQGVQAFASDDDEIIVIEEAEDAPVESPGERSNAYFGASVDIWAGYQFEALDAKPVRLLGEGRLYFSGELTPFLQMRINGIARVPMDIPLTPSASGLRVAPYFKFDDSYMKVSTKSILMQLGYLVIPWRQTKGARLSDRLNPVDYRRGPSLADGLSGRLPQWGAYASGQIFGMSVEGALLLQHDPSPGSLIASEQGGIEIARYQSAWLRDTASAAGISRLAQVGEVTAFPRILSTPTLALRIKNRLGAVHLGTTVIWGFDETPTVNLGAALAKNIGQRLRSPRVAAVCRPDLVPSVEDGCHLKNDSLSFARTVRFAADLSYNAGAVVIRSEIFAQPKIGDFGGKTTLLLGEEGLRSAQLSQFGASFSVEASYGRYVNLTLEIFDLIWHQVQRGDLLLGIDKFSQDTQLHRFGQRLAVALMADGMFLDEQFLWRIKSEIGILQPDVSLAADIRYVFDVSKFALGVYGNWYQGTPGSPGWMREKATSAGLFIHQKI